MYTIKITDKYDCGFVLALSADTVTDAIDIARQYAPSFYRVRIYITLDNILYEH